MIVAVYEKSDNRPTGPELKDRLYSIKDFDSVLGIFKDKNQTYAYAQAGVVLFTVIDVRYNLILNDLFNSRYFTDSLSFGFSLLLFLFTSHRS